MFKLKRKKIFFFILFIIISKLIISVFLIFNKADENIFIKIINDLNIQENHKVKVFVSLDTECPLSKYYTKKINDVSEKYNKDVLFICFFPGKHYTNKEVEDFKKIYNIKINSFIDKNLTLTKALDANVFPEVFVLNDDYKIVYKGLIDNWVGELGKTKKYINEEYLIDAIESSLNNDLPLIHSTKAIGCLIEK